MSEHMRMSKEIHEQIARQRALVDEIFLQSLKIARRQIHTSHDLKRTAKAISVPVLLKPAHEG